MDTLELIGMALLVIGLWVLRVAVVLCLVWLLIVACRVVYGLFVLWRTPPKLRQEVREMLRTGPVRKP